MITAVDKHYNNNHICQLWMTFYLRGGDTMAKNTGEGFRRGAVCDRSQTHNPKTDQWVKRGEDGRFMDVKQDGDPFKGVRKED